MSLRVWLPLTKDLRQQGLDNVTVTNNGATFNSAGKLGGCYEFASGKRIQTTLPSTSNLNSKAISFACWVNISSWNSSYDCLMSIADGTGWNQSRATLCRNNTASTLCWNIADGSTSTRVYTTTSLSTNTWYHIACTYDGASLKIYVNGTLNNSAAATLNIGYAGTFNIGGWSGNNYPINCKMNDVRVYSHCLSPMEVKELAKGLVLHYPLNRQGWGQNNLIVTNSMAPTSGTSGWSSAGTGWANSNVASSGASNGHAIRCTYSGTTQVSGGIHHPTGVDKTTLTTGAIYTLTARIRASKACIATFHNELMTTSNTINLTTDWKIYSYSCKIDNTRSYHSNVIYVRAADATQNMWIECDWIKLEEGAKSTPWVPNSAETLYTTMGLNSTTEYDCSGFGNNGTRTGTFTWTSDTPKYTASTYFEDGSTSYITSSVFMPTDKITTSVWFKGDGSTSGANSYHIPFCIGSGTAEFSVDGAKLYRQGYYINGTRYCDTISGAIVNDGQWHMMTATYDGITLCRYLDGQLINSKAISGTLNGGMLTLLIGKYYSGGYNNKKVKQSDVRIYATALSADDVKSLYQNSAYIDSSGNVYGAVHSEV
jgi:hypothetical protein